MSTFEVKPVPPYLRFVDHCLRPFMKWLGNNSEDSIQETHPWHTQPINPETVNLGMAVYTLGNDSSPHTNQKSPAFHAPRAGGWKEYTVYKAETPSLPFYIGWIARELVKGEWKLKEAAIHRLPIYDSQIRTLNGPIGHAAYFFALNANGEQVPLRAVDHGQLGDNRHPNVRLF